MTPQHLRKLKKQRAKTSSYHDSGWHKIRSPQLKKIIKNLRK